MDKPPYLSIVDGDHSHQSNDDEFLPLPDYPWDERPSTLPLDADELATAIHLSRGDEIEASKLLKVAVVRFRRYLRASPRLQRIMEEAGGINIAKAKSVIIKKLWDPNSNARELEWAATKILASRSAQGDPLSPAPAASLTTVSPNEQGTLILRWGEAPKEIDDGDSDPGSPAA